MCHECEKLWFGTASRGNVARECPDCGSRLTLLETADQTAVSDAGNAGPAARI